ncbi:hypothetical protein SEEB0197_10322 [Salmonella enterica subsp. enterica serovar Bareilly str. CFSAN000197]|nr:hypothetical protein SEEM031_11953 [Salmonella enterica subsp. enterica serovar Montevideo str. SARB31]ESH28634.1 hypothetical protein SEEGA711_04916 [Salmonella enterica subsp. enterica serovar Gaminara str. ATCC BAA-711]ESH67840.1 hypothetical protein SEEB0197_10322 [Salmonella enterica subsp. enterica serovar Bareilly str. CFSAN000197]ESJ62178.1 hypothetical protein CFSAN001077_23686 [Salmonella enterica subsp. enterica serovar Norwich str. CFSAN001077]
MYKEEMKMKKWRFLLAILVCALLAGCTIYYR